eukprot:TRINITY_DN7471_c1_g4_i2.p1 TRINITY_DN7471_c1_g4~~TRINITY_DN7471_c1_g4_i2.p1  ORF type:complete len:182 (+),score=6.56 TRINITY_DN7471_c1_g4_i2:144-689(+)
MWASHLPYYSAPAAEWQAAHPRKNAARAPPVGAMLASSEVDQEPTMSRNREQIQRGSGHASRIPPPELVPMPVFKGASGSSSSAEPDEQISASTSSSAGAPATRSSYFGHPSRGALLHAQGCCLPCRYHKHPDGCKVGVDCKYCHHAHDEWSLSKTVRYFRTNIAGYRAYYEPLLDDIVWQ